MFVHASYTENYFSEQYHKRDFTAGLSQRVDPKIEDPSAVHAMLTQKCVSMVQSEIAKMRIRAEAEHTRAQQAGVEF